jgi:hypothetical protein
VAENQLLVPTTATAQTDGVAASSSSNESAVVSPFQWTGQWGGGTTYSTSTGFASGTQAALTALSVQAMMHVQVLVVEAAPRSGVSPCISLCCCCYCTDKANGAMTTHRNIPSLAGEGREVAPTPCF